MMTVLVRYNRKDFFGNSVPVEDRKNNATKNDLVKSFSFFSRNRDAVVQIGRMVLSWGSDPDYRQRIVCVRVGRGNECLVGKISFERMKRNFYDRFKTSEPAA